MNRLQKAAIVLGAASLFTPALSGAGSAASVNVAATMTPRQVVTPANKPWHVPAGVKRARATLSGSMTANGRWLSWRISYAKFGDPGIVIADIHTSKPGTFGPILVRLCGPCKSGQSGLKKLDAGALQEFKSGNAWITLITNEYPNGVVRGTIRVR